MNANPKFLAATAHVDAAAVQALPNSAKIYVGPLRVPMREITQSGGNPPIAVYDTSGPYTDPAARIDIRKGLFPFRQDWIEARGDTQLLENPSSAYGRKRLEDPGCASTWGASPAEASASRRCTTRGRGSSPPRWSSSRCARTNG
jgi:phosphomethylpyrimidine synthase